MFGRRHWTRSSCLLSDLHRVDMVWSFIFYVFWFWSFYESHFCDFKYLFLRSCFHLSSLSHRYDQYRGAVMFVSSKVISLMTLMTWNLLPVKGNTKLVLGTLLGPSSADSSSALGESCFFQCSSIQVSWKVLTTDFHTFFQKNGFFCRTERKIIYLLFEFWCALLDFCVVNCFWVSFWFFSRQGLVQPEDNLAKHETCREFPC